MNIVLNGERRELRGPTVGDVLEEIGLADARVTTALNGSFLPMAERMKTRLRDGDALEVLSSMQGG